MKSPLQKRHACGQRGLILDMRWESKQPGRVLGNRRPVWHAAMLNLVAEGKSLWIPA